jgi:hypothetical protein
MDKTFADLTKYPKFYKNTYWGNFLAKDDHLISDEIINNRNKMVENFKIKSHTKNIPVFLNKYQGRFIIDHQEFYRLENKKILMIFSPYGNFSLEDIKDLNDKYGFELLDSVYSVNSITFGKILNN